MTNGEIDFAAAAAPNDSMINRMPEGTYYTDASENFQKELFTTTSKTIGATKGNDKPAILDFSKGDLFAQAKCGQTVDGGRQVKCPPPEWIRRQDVLRTIDLTLEPQRELTEMAHRLFAKDLERNLISGDFEGLKRNLGLLEGNPELAAKVIKLLQERLELSGIRVHTEDKADGVGGYVVTLKLSRNNNASKSSGVTDFEINSQGATRARRSNHFLAKPETINPQAALTNILRGRINLSD